MLFNYVNVSLTPSQIQKLQLSPTTSITLKPAQMLSGLHKIALTKAQLKHFNAAIVSGKSVQLKFSKAAIANMKKSGGIFPLIPLLGALATGVISVAAGWGTKKLLDKATGSGIRRKKRGSGVLQMFDSVLNDVISAPPTAQSFIKNALFQALKKRGSGLRLPGSRYSRTIP